MEEIHYRKFYILIMYPKEIIFFILSHFYEDYASPKEELRYRISPYFLYNTKEVRIQVIILPTQQEYS